MRIVQGSIREAFHVHKMYLEFLSDTGQSREGIEKDLSIWLPKFGNPFFFCLIEYHGKKLVGMTWGTVPKDETSPKKLTVEGLFVKRGFRGRLKAVQELSGALRELANKTNSVAVSSIVPENCLRGLRRKGFKVSALIVEKDIRGDSWQAEFKRPSLTL